MLVTEPCIPFEEWLKQKKKELNAVDDSTFVSDEGDLPSDDDNNDEDVDNDSFDDFDDENNNGKGRKGSKKFSNSKNSSKRSGKSTKESPLFHELIWGFRCILKGLEFLHSNCFSIHGNLNFSSIFICSNGDWKLSCFELLCNVNHSDDMLSFLAYHYIIGDKEWISPERASLTDNSHHQIGSNNTADSQEKNIEEIMKSSNPPYYLDIYSFGKIIQKVFTSCHITLSKEDLSFKNYLLLMVGSTYKKRPTAKKLLSLSTFHSNYMKILENIQEFSLKSNKEILESIEQMNPLLSFITVSICNYKLLPNIMRILQMNINDYSNRDAREGVRQVTSSVNFLCFLLMEVSSLLSGLVLHLVCPVGFLLFAFCFLFS
jgi:hypothetical protein